MTGTPIPTTIVTGFLGSGKTTLVNALLRDPAFAGTAVLINEFGDVQIDHDLVAEFGNELVMTTTGCLCCTASSDIKQSLHDLLAQSARRKIGPFKRVIVETTGLMDPVPVIGSLINQSTLGTIDRMVRERFMLARVVTLFDIINGPMTLDHHVEAVRQVALSDIVLLTKTDVSQDPATLADIQADRQRIASINPSATILDRHKDWSQLRALLLSSASYDLGGKGDDAIAWLQAEQVHAHDAHEHVHVDRTLHRDDIRSHAIFLDNPVSPEALSSFLEALSKRASTDLLRIKGLIALSDDPDRPVVVHGVQHLVHPVDRLARWPSEDRRSKIVVIGRNLDAEGLCGLLQSDR